MKTAIILCAGALLTLAAPGRATAQATASPVDTARVYEVSEVTRRPELTNRSTVSRALARGYPRALRNSGQSGSATIRMVIGRDGSPETLTVVRADEPAFGTAGVEVMRQARFTPALVDGVRVRVAVVLPVSFTLESATPSVVPEPQRTRRQ